MFNFKTGFIKDTEKKEEVIGDNLIVKKVLYNKEGEEVVISETKVNIKERIELLKEKRAELDNEITRLELL